MSKPAVLAIRAISMERLSRTVIEATTSPRASFSLTLFRRMSLAGTSGTPWMRPIGLASPPDSGYDRFPMIVQPDKARSVMKYDTNFKSVKDEVSAEEWQARVELAACYRLGDQYEMTDLIYNHITARIPGTEHLLINLYGLLYKEITASSLVKIDVEGEIIHKPDTDYGINKSGYVIHGAIHKARPDVKCVLHTHTRAGVAVSAMNCGLLPLSQTSIRFHNHIGYHDFEGPAVDLEERERIVDDLGEHNALVMKNHGLITCGPSVPEAFNLMYQLEQSCRSQVDAMAARTELNVPGENVLAHNAHLYQPRTRRPYGVLERPAMVRLLDAEQKGSAYPPYWH